MRGPAARGASLRGQAVQGELAPCAVIAIVIALNAAPAIAGTPAPQGRTAAPSSAVLRAKAYIRTKTSTGLALNQTTAYRSSRNRRWVLASGFLRDRRLWAVWLRHDGRRWIVKTGGVAVVKPRVRVPCDMDHAFSEPSC